MFGIKKDLNIHFIGIGGIGMSGIANVLLNLGYNVSGSDINRNENIEKLEVAGAKIFHGHHEANIDHVQLVVYSSAIDNKNPEIKKAKELKIPIVKRAEMLAELMRVRYGIAIAGSHGKTTTTSFVSTIFNKLDQKPTCVVGGVVKNLGSQSIKGDGQYLIAEADESDGSFLFLNPIMSVITNVDNDHLDYYGTEEKIKEAFVEFSNKIPFYGRTAINANDKNSCELIKNLRRPYVTFGLAHKKSCVENLDYAATDIVFKEDETLFSVIHEGKCYKTSIALSGDHNVQNALAAIAISHQVGLKLEDICRALKDFSGVGRRFEMLHDGNFTVVDDYGHHPTEIRATIETARVRFPDKKLVVVFEPHRYTRTKDFWEEFSHSFSLVDEVYIAPIYPASEKPITGITSENLIKDINKADHNANEIDLNNGLTDLFDKYASTNTVLLSLGAGSISKLTRVKLNEWKS